MAYENDIFGYFVIRHYIVLLYLCVMQLRFFDEVSMQANQHLL